MNPVAKTLLIIFGFIIGILLIPVFLILLRDYINAIIFFVTVITLLVLFIYECYHEFYPIIHKEKMEEDEIFHRFHGDPEKMRFYKAFKKHFDGELSVDGLKEWLINYPSKKH